MYNMDIKRLQRDYIDNPLKRGEKPNKDDLEYLYLELNMGKNDLCKYLNVSSTTLQRILHSFDIKKTNEQLQELAKKGLGCSSPFCRKETHIKSQQTKLKRYGDEKYNNSQKNKETSMDRYGVSNPTKKHISSEILKIVDNKDNLLNFINDNKILNIVDLQTKLNIGYKTLQRRICEWNLYHLFDYTKSVSECQLKDYINKYYETENNVKILNGKEIDIYVPKLNIGIEFNGNYYHNEFAKQKKYHQEKSLLAEENGIFLYHVFEYEWNTKREQIINQLNNLLGINENKIYARKCEIRNVENKETTNFLQLNHMQGDDNGSTKLGLYYNNELVSIMTFCKPRFNKNYEWELSRFCSKANCNVVGGASKLFKYFIKIYNPKSIISYSNIAHTRGNLYNNLGFILKGISNPNYVWYKNGCSVLTRYQCQKHKLIKEGFEGKSETDIMHNRGYYRIYDCGNKVWVWSI